MQLTRLSLVALCFLQGGVQSPRKEKPLRETFAYRWSRFVQAHPWPIAIATTALLLVMTLPLLGIRAVTAKALVRKYRANVALEVYRQILGAQFVDKQRLSQRNAKE